MNTPLTPDLKILVIDDEWTILEALESILEALGYTEIQTTSSCQEGLEFAQSGTFDLIICDFTMCPIDGLQIHESTTTPTILITASVSTENRKSLSESGVIYLEKPFPINDLQAAITQALS